MASPDMLLPIPVVGVTSGPQWASSLVDCLNIIDSHTHAPGSGVQITPDGLNITTDLSFQNNSLTEVLNISLTEQSSPTVSNGSLYRDGDDLYYIDGAGNDIQITASGGVAGTPGSIGNLVAPASASYVAASSKFVFQSDSTTSASLDCGPLIIRQLSASSNACTLNPPSALASNYDLYLPNLPASDTRFVLLNSSGVMSATYAPDNTSLEFSGTSLQVKASGITTAKIADLNVTTAKIAAANVTPPKLSAPVYSISSAASQTTSTAVPSYAAVGTLSVTISSTDLGAGVGRPVEVGFIAPNSSACYIAGYIAIQIRRNGSAIATYYQRSTTSGITTFYTPGSSVRYVDLAPPAGSNTYTVYIAEPSSGVASGRLENVALYARET